MLPFLGQADEAYVPDGKVIGLSKIPRIVEVFSRRLRVQERMTQQIAEFLNDTLHPCGVAVVAEGLHMCAAMRGVQKANARMTTSAMLATFKDNLATRTAHLAAREASIVDITPVLGAHLGLGAVGFVCVSERKQIE
jgi:GTP cyclohydrolase I